MVKRVGLTGGIGAGKSTVAAILREHGIPVLDADLVARQVVEPGQPVYAAIARAWPEVVGPDGRLERKRLADVVFADPASKARLEALMHPAIRQRIAEETAALAAAGASLVVVEAALLVETGFYRELDGLVVVVASEATQIARVMTRDSCTREQAVARLRAQAKSADKTRVADFVIDNDGSLAQTRERVGEVLAGLRGSA